MITYKSGNIFNDPSEALVNAVNTVGVMGKGVALQFKIAFPECYNAYTQALKNKTIGIGIVQFVPIANSTTTRYIINFPTKEHWRNPSQLTWIEDGLKDLSEKLQSKRIQSVALPALGCGNGKLHWNDVKILIEDHLSKIDCDINVYQPQNTTA